MKLNTLRPDIARGQLLAHLQTPLYRNGYALTLSSAASSALGMVYWVLAARLYNSHDVGIGTALTAAMLLLSGVAQLSMTGVLVRFLPLAGQDSGRLVGYGYAICILLSELIATVFALGVDLWSPALGLLNDNLSILCGFVIATTAWTVFALQDSVLTGLRQAHWVPLENTLFALAKIGLLLLLAGLPGALGILTSWSVPVLVSLLPVNLLIFRRLIPAHVAAGTEVRFTPRQVLRFIGGNYFGSLFFLASTTLLPLLVADGAGPVANAHFYLPWVIASGVQFFALNMATSLTVEATREQHKLGFYFRRVLAQVFGVLAPLVLLLVLAAPLILAAVGDSYASEGSSVLRLLLLACLPNAVVVLFISLARVQNRAASVLATQAALCAITLALSYLLLPHLGITGVGIAYLSAQGAVAALVFWLWLRPLLRRAASD